jgi:hypothetical protein
MDKMLKNNYILQNILTTSEWSWDDDYIPLRMPPSASPGYKENICHPGGWSQVRVGFFYQKYYVDIQK